MRISNVMCDSCEKDISSTSNCEDYRLHLEVESLPKNSPMVTLMGIPRPLDRDYHFCDMDCLSRWATSRHFDLK